MSIIPQFLKSKTKTFLQFFCSLPLEGSPFSPHFVPFIHSLCPLLQPLYPFHSREGQLPSLLTFRFPGYSPSSIPFFFFFSFNRRLWEVSLKCFAPCSPNSAQLRFLQPWVAHITSLLAATAAHRPLGFPLFHDEPQLFTNSTPGPAPKP